MKRLFIVYNPHSSRYSDIKEEVFGQLKNLKGYMVGKYKIEKTDVDDNANKFAKILKDGDLVVSAGGDATGVVASNAILKSGKDACLAVLPYGNFNDLSRTLGTKTLEDALHGRVTALEGVPRESRAGEDKSRQDPPGILYPLEIYVNGKFFRYATCYVTIGMMAEAVKLYDQPRMRKILKSSIGRNIGSYTNLAGWYFKNRHKKQFLPEFKLNKKLIN